MEKRNWHTKRRQTKQKHNTICVEGYSQERSECTNLDIHVFIAAHTAVKPMFYALDNPCMEKYRLCPVVCSVVTLKNDVQCQFCFCKDATNNSKCFYLDISTLE